MKLKTIAVLSFLVLSISCNFCYAQDEFCAICSREAWEGDSTALNKFMESCGVIDTVYYGEKEEPVQLSENVKPVKQTVTMKLNSGKVMYTEEIYFVVEKMPEFPGGESALLKYLQKESKYPSEALKGGVGGTVFVSYIIDTNGVVTKAKIIRSVGHGCDEEAIRVINNMPRWKPGYHKGNRVNVKMNLPVKFVLK